jgi:two-component system cell cycle sensor histidine kinase/response regulator CckA
MAPEKTGPATASEGRLLTFIKGSVRLKQPAAQRVNIVIVDDEEPVRRYVERVLRDAGYSTSLAADGPEAIALAAHMDTIDILVTDLMMPAMQGDELARRLRQDRPGLKVLYLTGYSDHLFKEKTTLWADEAFLEKPCSVQGLRQAVSLLLFGRFERSDVRTS